MRTSHTTKEVQKEGLYDLKTSVKYQGLLPEMSEQEYAELKESIRTSGQHEPVTVDENFVVLDGHHRIKACRELGITPVFVIKKFESEEDRKNFVIQVNLRRRHLNDFQRIEVVHKLEKIEADRARKRRLKGLRKGKAVAGPSVQNDPDGEKGRVIDRCGSMACVSGNTYRNASKIIESGSEELVEKLRDGHISINHAYGQLLKGKAKGNKDADDESDSKLPFRPTIKQISKKAKMIYGELKSVTERELPAESMNLIVSDYYAYMPGTSQFCDLAKFAARALKSDGILAVSVYPSRIPEITAAIRRSGKGLDLCWTFTARTRRVTVETSNVTSMTKIYLLYSRKGASDLLSSFVDFMDITQEDEEDSMSDWFRETEYLVDFLTLENGTVCWIMSNSDNSNDYHDNEGALTKLAAQKRKRAFVGIHHPWDASSYKDIAAS